MSNSDGILHVPIQINGGEDTPDINELKERELYINTSDDILQYGKKEENSVKRTNVKVDTSVNSENIVSSDGGKRFYLKSKSNEGRIADFSIYEHELVGRTDEYSNYPKISNTHLNNVRTMVLGYGNGAKMFGTKLPTSGQEGQLFFLIKE